MNREEILNDLLHEGEMLILLHRRGLYDSPGYQERRKKILASIQANDIDVLRELGPVYRVLYQRYFS